NRPLFLPLPSPTIFRLFLMHQLLLWHQAAGCFRRWPENGCACYACSTRLPVTYSAMWRWNGITPQATLYLLVRFGGWY
ncbi:hypothetical protein C8R44DRAFT_760867, partial [Mycena epipterygia]